MVEYHIIWLIAIACGLVAGVTIIGLGCYMLRRAVEDLSNSTALAAFGLRLFRLTPGGLIVVFGCFAVWQMLKQILALTLPTQL